MGTIITYEDLIEVNQAINDSVGIIHGNINLYIGMYAKPRFWYLFGSRSELSQIWQWIISEHNISVSPNVSYPIDTEVVYGAHISSSHY